MLTTNLVDRTQGSFVKAAERLADQFHIAFATPGQPAAAHDYVPQGSS